MDPTGALTQLEFWILLIANAPSLKAAHLSRRIAGKTFPAPAEKRLIDKNEVTGNTG
jgi:hypothetical protein